MKKKIILISMYVLTVLLLFVTIASYVVVSILTGFSVDYSHPDDYTTTNITISYLQINEEIISIESVIGQYFFIDGNNYDIVIAQQFESIINVDDQITITYGRKGFGDSYEYPIVMIEKSGVVLLDYETGFDNLNEASISARRSAYVQMIYPFGAFLIALLASIYLTNRFKRPY